MKKRSFLAILLALVMALTACGGGGGKPSGDKDDKQAGEAAVYRTLYATEVTTLNYLVTPNTNDQAIPANVIDTLVEYDNLGQIKPGLATEWSYDEASFTWTFKLRDAKWVNNKGEEVAPVTANDFVSAMKYMLTPEYEAANIQNVLGIIKNSEAYFNGQVYKGGADSEGVVWPEVAFDEVGVKAVDDQTLTYTLEKETPYFLSSLAYVVYMPAYGPLLEETGKTFATSAETMYYNGAYYLESFEPQMKRVLKKNALNYDAENVFIETIEQTFNAEAPTIGPEMVKRGEIDYASISSDILDEWLKNDDTKNLVSRERPDSSFSYFFCFNFDPQFDAEYEPENWKLAVNNENFRKALVAAMDRTKAMHVMETEAPEDYLQKSITPYNFAFDASQNEYTSIGKLANLGDSFDATKAVEFKDLAKAELETAGASFPIKVLMPYNPNVNDWDKECQVIEQQMEEVLGADFIDIIVEAGPSDSFLTQVRRSGKYAFMKCNWGADYADPETWIYPFYQKASTDGSYDVGFKYAFMANAITTGGASADVVKEYFALVEKALAITSEAQTDERYAAFAEAESFLIEHALVMPYSISPPSFIATKLNVFEGQYASFGSSTLRYKGQKLQDTYVSMEQYEANRDQNAKDVEALAK